MEPHITSEHPMGEDVKGRWRGSSSSLLSDSAWRSLRKWYCRNGRHSLPWRQGMQPWAVLLAETLLHRTNARQVSNLYPSLLKEFGSPREVVENRESWLLQTKSLGLGWRSTSFADLCSVLLAKHGGVVPEDRAALIALPGVGHYIAGAVQCFGFETNTLIVDTNTIRIAARISGEDASPNNHRASRVHKLVARIAPDGRLPSPNENYALLDLAALVCLPKRANCDSCPLNTECVIGMDQRVEIGSTEKQH